MNNTYEASGRAALRNAFGADLTRSGRKLNKAEQS